MHTKVMSFFIFSLTFQKKKKFKKLRPKMTKIASTAGVFGFFFVSLSLCHVASLFCVSPSSLKDVCRLVALLTSGNATDHYHYPTTLDKKKTATTIMHKIRTLFLSWDIEKSSLIALRCAAMREVAASRATVPISWSCWYCVIRTVFWFYA